MPARDCSRAPSLPLDKDVFLEQGAGCGRRARHREEDGVKPNGKTAGGKKTKHPLGLATHIKKQTPTIFQKKLSFEQGGETFNMAYLVLRQYLSHKQLPLPTERKR